MTILLTVEAITEKSIFKQFKNTKYDGIYVYDFKRKSFGEKEILDKEQELRHLMKLTTENLLLEQLEYWVQRYFNILEEF